MANKVDFNDLPLHTNKAIAAQKQKRAKISKKSQAAVDSGDIQSVIDSLNERQRRFCEEYLVDLNATKAVERCGYNTKFANRVGYQLMENPAIRITIDALRVERTKTTDVTKDYVLQQIMRTIRAAEEDGNHGAVLRGSELLARHLGMFIERTEISGRDGGAIEMEQRKVAQEADEFTTSLKAMRDRLKEAPVLAAIK